MSPHDISAAREAIIAAAYQWPDADVLRLAAVIGLGSPTDLHAGKGVALTCEHEKGDGDVPAMRPTADARGRLAADMLHVYRGAGQACGQPMPPPGKM